MAEGRIKNTELSAIAAAIRQKNGSATTYKPAEMAQAILDIPTGITPTGTVNITQNGTTDVTQYASANVNVPNSYATGDEGKVVSNGALVAQTSRASAITQNGTYDTTTNDEVTVNVSGGGGDPLALSSYIQGDGHSYIDTGYRVADNTRIELVATVPDDNQSYPVFGVRARPSGYADAYGCLMYAGDTNANTITGQFGGNQDYYSGAMRYGEKSVFRLAKQMLIRITSDWDISQYSISYSYAPVSNYNLALFTVNSAGTTFANCSKMKLYRFRIYEGSILIMELLPAVDGNSVVCLQDTVSGDYFYNAGTGAFTYGTDS